MINMIGTFVYIVYCENTTAIKVGYSNNPFKRLASMQTGCPHRLNILSIFIGGLEDEQELHDLLFPYRLEGEWFTLCLESFDIINKFQGNKMLDIFNLQPFIPEFYRVLEEICTDYIRGSKTKRRTRVPLKHLRLALDLPIAEIKKSMLYIGFVEFKDKSSNVFFIKNNT